MQMCGRAWILTILACLAASFFIACAAEKKYKVLSTVFDGVPTPEEREAKKLAKKKAGEPEQAVVAAAVDSSRTGPPAEPPRPLIETVKTWEEVLKLLPRDPSGGVDWVTAVRENVIAPRHRLPSDSQPASPFTLDTLVPGTVSGGSPALDLNIEMVPQKTPFYKVVFPHAGHTMWLNCSSCHPGIGAERGSGMQKILAGEYCGRCHGKVSFAPLSSCARCHVNLAPARPETVETDLEKATKETVPASPELVARGQSLYLQACAPCHGEKGDGTGPLASVLSPKPRNFTMGKFKFRSTNSSSLPTDSDLFRTITRGVPGTSMPAFSFLSYEDRFAIAHYLKTFSDKFGKQKPANPIKIPDPPPLTAEVMDQGKKFFNDAECFKCHGEQGRGDGPSAVGMKDDWGEPLRPFDFTTGKPKSGTSLKDYYKVVMTGLQGTPMPDFGDAFEPEQAWSVVYYVRSLGNANRELPSGVKGDIHFTRRSPENAGSNASPAEQPTATPTPAAAAQSDSPDNIAPATFPHWFHRVRVRCNVCHSSIFQMRAGANPITMDAIRAGQFCGKCHPSYPDGKALAWPVAFESCVRCHAAQ